MMDQFIVAAIQMDTQNDKEQNLQQMVRYIDEAVAKGAKLIAFPEVVNILSELPVYAEPIPGPTTELLMQKAKEHRVWIHGGSISEANAEGARTYNTSVLIDPDGKIVAKYRKLHNLHIK